MFYYFSLIYSDLALGKVGPVGWKVQGLSVNFSDHGRIQRSLSLKERGQIVCWREAWPCKSWMTCVLLPLLLAGCSCHPLDLDFLNYNLDRMICIYLESFCWAAGSYGNVFATKSPCTYLTSLWLLGIIFEKGITLWKFGAIFWS